MNAIAKSTKVAKLPINQWFLELSDEFLDRPYKDEVTGSSPVRPIFQGFVNIRGGTWSHVRNLNLPDFQEFLLIDTGQGHPFAFLLSLTTLRGPEYLRALV